MDFDVISNLNESYYFLHHVVQGDATTIAMLKVGKKSPHCDNLCYQMVMNSDFGSN